MLNWRTMNPTQPMDQDDNAQDPLQTGIFKVTLEEWRVLCQALETPRILPDRVLNVFASRKR